MSDSDVFCPVIVDKSLDVSLVFDRATHPVPTKIVKSASS